ncbi:MAG TPA: hypothetical protein VJB87_04305 [Candidatus Nanoarchaeia archaeon]|nr:hypothetical protein [Candidatus Nanoarchaeia archaeon]
MQSVIIPPELIFVPEPHIGRPDILLRYVRSIQAGLSMEPGPLVVDKRKMPERLYDHVKQINTGDYYFHREITYILPESNPYLFPAEELEEFRRTILDHPAQYFLVDGNHRGTALRLCNRPIQCLELENNHDLAQVRTWMKRGEYTQLNWRIDGTKIVTSLPELAQSFAIWRFLYGGRALPTLEDKAREALQNLSHLEKEIKDLRPSLTQVH